jgi:hypothetical protein
VWPKALVGTLVLELSRQQHAQDRDHREGVLDPFGLHHLAVAGQKEEHHGRLDLIGERDPL